MLWIIIIINIYNMIWANIIHIEWQGGPWYNIFICEKLHGIVFEEIIRNSRTDRYNFICYIDANEKKPPEHDDGISSGGYTLPSN